MNFRKYLPYENFVLTSRLSAEEIMNRLGDAVGPEHSQIYYWFNRVSESYEGDLRNTTFKISEIIYNREKQFVPQITGRISTLTDKTEIRISMRLPIPTTIIFSIWLSTIGFFCLYLLVTDLWHIHYILRHGFNPAELVLFIIFAVTSGIITYKFKAASRGSKAFLMKLMEAKENI